jgi:hypothetical protein
MIEKRDENEARAKEFWQREDNKNKIRKLAALMKQAVDNPRVTNEELEMIANLRAGPHELDTAADACPR